MKLTWRDIDEIAIVLVETYPDVDPMSVGNDELQEMVTGLPAFSDDYISFVVCIIVPICCFCIDDICEKLLRLCIGIRA